MRIFNKHLRKWFSQLKQYEIEELYQYWIKQQDVKKLVSISSRNNDFYKSPEWLKTRYNILKIDGRRCRLCGTKDQSKEYHVDHIKPRWLYPELAFNEKNLRVLCRDCNMAKGGNVPLIKQTTKIIRRRKNELINKDITS